MKFLLFFKLSYLLKSAVQCGHLTASIAISLLQYGHAFVVGAGAGSSFLVLLNALTIKKIQKAIIKKSMMFWIKAPYLNRAAPASSAAARLA